MLVIPAIDLKNGKCVRLEQGRPEQETVYDSDPAKMARNFTADGAKMLHLVDLDGAFQGKSGNLESIKAIRASVEIPLELGGGLRSLENIEAMLDLGVNSVILGTVAVNDPGTVMAALEKFGPERIQIGIDAKDGFVAVKGWAEVTDLEAVVFGLEWKERGVERAIFTDIGSDGMLGGPNLVAIRHFAEATGLRVTASGGIADKADVRSIAALGPAGVDRLIIGKAFYEGTLKLAEVVDL